MHREDAQLAERWLHLVGVVLLDEEACQALGAHVLRNALGVAAAARGLQRLRINVGGKHLDARHAREAVHVLAQEDGERVGFFPGGAAGHAHAHLVGGALAREQLGQHVRSRAAKASGSRKKCVTPMSKSLNRNSISVGSCREAGDVAVHGVELQRLHAPLQAAADRALLVLAKVMAGVAPEQPMDRVELVARLRGPVRGVCGAEPVRCVAYSTSLAGIASTGRIWSTRPVAMALRRMLS